VSVATGDSENTALAIMKQLDQVHGDPVMFVAGSAAITVDEDELDKKMKHIRSLKVKPGEDRAIVVDGKTLAVIVNGKHKKEFAELLVNKFQTRIFARVSAIQKAEIVQLYKSMGKRVFSIGDGGNDVTMIQEGLLLLCPSNFVVAHFGVGIRGVEGHQAASAADFQLTRFQEVQTVLAHSLRSHFRLATVYLWNDYKAVLIAMIAYLSRALRGFQGDALIPGNVIFSLNTLDLAYPVVLFGMFDELVPLTKLIKESKHYSLGQKLEVSA
jgi:magnesium-transporting ATPase (P-type)